MANHQHAKAKQTRQSAFKASVEVISINISLTKENQVTRPEIKKQETIPHL